MAYNFEKKKCDLCDGPAERLGFNGEAWCNRCHREKELASLFALIDRRKARRRQLPAIPLKLYYIHGRVLGGLELVEEHTQRVVWEEYHLYGNWHEVKLDVRNQTADGASDGVE